MQWNVIRPPKHTREHSHFAAHLARESSHLLPFLAHALHRPFQP